jgi:hypothetical protein
MIGSKKNVLLSFQGQKRLDGQDAFRKVNYAEKIFKKSRYILQIFLAVIYQFVLEALEELIYLFID